MINTCTVYTGPRYSEHRDTKRIACHFIALSLNSRKQKGRNIYIRTCKYFSKNTEQNAAWSTFDGEIIHFHTSPGIIGLEIFLHHRARSNLKLTLAQIPGTQRRHKILLPHKHTHPLFDFNTIKRNLLSKFACQRRILIGQFPGIQLSRWVRFVVRYRDRQLHTAKLDSLVYTYNRKSRVIGLLFLFKEIMYSQL